MVTWEAEPKEMQIGDWTVLLWEEPPKWLSMEEDALKSVERAASGDGWNLWLGTTWCGRTMGITERNGKTVLGGWAEARAVADAAEILSETESGSGRRGTGRI